MINKRKIALVGIGYWGKNILRNLHELQMIKIACDLDKRNVNQWKKVYSDLAFTDSYEEVLSDKDIRGVVIATPAVTHYEFTRQALKAGKDVMVEKPLAMTVEEGEDLIEIAKKNKCILMVGHILHYHPAIIKLKSMIEKGDLGKIQYIYSNRLNIGKLRTEENILWSFAPHDISVILSLAGDNIKSVSASAGDYLNKGIYDTTVTHMAFKGGIKGHIFVSWLHPFKEQKLVIVGSKSMAVFDDMAKDKLSIFSHAIRWQSGNIPIAKKADRRPVKLKEAEPLKEEMKHFYECISKRKRPLTDGYEGLEVLKVLSDIESSIGSPDDIKTTQDKKAPKIHPTAIVDEGVIVGSNVSMWHFSHILKGSEIGSGCRIGQNVVIGPNVKVGKGCKIQNNVSVYEGVTLEDDVFCGPSCVFTNVINPRSEIPRMDELRKTMVKKGAAIGANATILCGNTIGAYAFIGAGSTVTKNVLPYALMVGSPARRVGWMCSCGVRLSFKTDTAKCEDCGIKYHKINEGIEPVR